MVSTKLTTLAALLAFPLAACDAQNDGKYNGDPLVTLTGTVENRNATVPAGVDLVIAYLVPPPDPERSFCLLDAYSAYHNGDTPDLGCRFENLAPERVEVTGQFPTAFSFTLTQPPPANALLDAGEGVKGALALIFAVKEGSADDGELLLGDLLGFSPYFLAYNDRAAVAPHACRKAADGTLSCGAERLEAGFHLGKGLCGGKAIEPGDICSVLVDGEPITVDLTDDLETIVQESVTIWLAD